MCAVLCPSALCALCFAMFLVSRHIFCGVMPCGCVIIVTLGCAGLCSAVLRACSNAVSQVSSPPFAAVQTGAQRLQRELRASTSSAAISWAPATPSALAQSTPARLFLRRGLAPSASGLSHA